MVDFSQKTILFGGSFDPIHLGHLYVVECLKKSFPHVSQILLVPANQSPGKLAPKASGTLRTQWINSCELSTWNYELQKDGASFTVELLREAHRLGAKTEDLYFVIGGDAYQHFSQWKEPEQIRRQAQLIVVSRPGNLLSSQDPRDLLISVPGHEASSTRVREALAKGMVPVELLTPPVAEILNNLILQSQNPYAMQKV